MRRLVMGAAGAALALIPAQAAWAQDDSHVAAGPAFLRGWDGEVNVTLSPTLGRDSPLSLDLDTVDESGAEFYVRATRPLAGPMKLRLQAGVTASPNFLDDDDVGSAYYLQVSIGEADDNLSRLIALNSSGAVGAAALQDTVLPYARLRYTRSFESESLFTTEKAEDRQLVVGARFRDVRGIMCEPAEVERRRQVTEGPLPDCSGPRGVYLEFDPRLTIVQSNLPGRERAAPSFRAQLVSRPIWRGTRLFGEAYGEISYYTEARVPAGQRREDRVRRFTAGINLSDLVTPWLKRRGGFMRAATADVSLGLRYERKVSNNPDTAYERWFVVPSAGISWSF